MDYVIGDVQGMYDELIKLLDVINYNDGSDRLWFVGDLVNRGPHSAKVLELLMGLKSAPIVTLGNHDLHLLSVYHQAQSESQDDTLQDVLTHPNVKQLIEWLQAQRLCYLDKTHRILMSHAGIPPFWRAEQVISLAQEVESILKSPLAKKFYQHMYGNTPASWNDALKGYDRLRTITNYLTRMRWLDSNGALLLEDKGNQAPANSHHWFKLKRQEPLHYDIMFGHWAAINGITHEPHIHALDTGCVWGGVLTAICLQTKKRYTHLT